MAAEMISKYATVDCIASNLSMCDHNVVSLASSTKIFYVSYKCCNM